MSGQNENKKMATDLHRQTRIKKEGEKMVGRFKVDNKQAKSALEANIQNLKADGSIIILTAG